MPSEGRFDGQVTFKYYQIVKHGGGSIVLLYWYNTQSKLKLPPNYFKFTARQLKLMLQQNDYQKQTSEQVSDWINQANNKLLEWSFQSPNPELIEYLRTMLKHQVCASNLTNSPKKNGQIPDQNYVRSLLSGTKSVKVQLATGHVTIF